MEKEREIKFRYRIKDTFTGKIEFRYLTLNEIEGGLVFNNIGLKHEVLSRDQFTGRSDKNRKDIYESDIVIAKYNGSFRAPVVYDRGSFKLDCGRDIRNRPYIPLEDWCQENAKTIEVIGNIHENSEMLREIKK